MPLESGERKTRIDFAAMRVGYALVSEKKVEKLHHCQSISVLQPIRGNIHRTHGGTLGQQSTWEAR